MPRNKSRKTQAKIAKLLENQEISKAILQSLEEELPSVRNETDNVNMDLNEHAEPGQTCAGKEQHAAAHVSPIGEAWDFMNMGAEIEPNLEDELPQPPCWEHCQQNRPEGCVCSMNDLNW